MLRLICTKFDFGWDSAPNPAGGGAHSAPPNSLAEFKGAYSRVRDGNGKERGREGQGRGRRGQGEKKKGRGIGEGREEGKGRRGEENRMVASS